MTAGVPQGSVLVLLLFLVYVNNIVDQILSITCLFADNTSLSTTSSSAEDLECIMNHDLALLNLGLGSG